MSQHEHDISPVRTFSDDLRRVRGLTGSHNTDVSEPSVTPSETAAPAVQLDRPLLNITPNTPQTPARSAFDYLANKSAAPTTQAVPTPTEAVTPTPSISPTIPKIAPATIEAEVAQVASTSKPSILASEDTFEEDSLGDGVIVQDKKRKSYSLLKSVGGALGGWAKAQEQALHDARQPEHTITKAEARLETIKAAAESSKRVPENDHASIVAKVKAAPTAPVKTGIVLKDKSAVPSAQWTYYDETRLDAPAPEVMSETPAAEATPQPQVESTLPVTEFTQEPEPVAPEVGQLSVDQSDRTFAEVENPSAEMYEDPVIDEARSHVWEQSRNDVVGYGQTESVPQQQSNAETLPVATIPTSVVPQPTEAFSEALRAAAARKTALNQQTVPPVAQTLRLNPLEIPLYAFVLGLLFVCLLGISLSLYLFERAGRAPDVAETPQLVALLNLPETPVAFTADTLALRTRLETTRQTGQSARQIVFTREDETTVSPNLAIVTLLPGIPNALARNLTNLSVGFTDANRTYLVLEATNYDTLFGGMLNWESTMARDLESIMNLGALLGAEFSDTVVAGMNARVLTAESGEPILYYVFISDRVVIMTTERQAVIEIAAKRIE